MKHDFAILLTFAGCVAVCSYITLMLIPDIPPFLVLPDTWIERYRGLGPQGIVSHAIGSLFLATVLWCFLYLTWNGLQSLVAKKS